MPVANSRLNIQVRTSFRRLLLGVIALAVSACSQFNFAVVNLPTHFSAVQKQADIEFDHQSGQQLDIYRPADLVATSSLPVIIFFYDGSWEDGSKDDYAFVGNALAKEGYVVVIPDYRKFPSVKFPTFVEDGAAAVAWTSDHVTQYGGDPAQIHLAGHSAGGQIAALLATDPHYLQVYGKQPNKVIKDFVGLAGPYDFTPDSAKLRAIFAPPADYPLLKATTFVDGHQPPMLLMWGTKDEYVGRQNIDRLSAAIHRRGGVVEEKIYPGLNHEWLIANLSWLGSLDKYPVLRDWLAFIRTRH